MSAPNEHEEEFKPKGLLEYMASNSVAANLLMLVLIVGGAIMAPRIKQEVFPEFDLDYVQIEVAFPGASPEDVESGVVQAIEEEVRGLDGVKSVRSYALEGRAAVSVELLLGTNPNEALNDIKSAVDRITSFPADAEEPIISLLSNRQRTLSLMIYGDASEEELRDTAYSVRDALLLDSRITQAEIGGVREPEISIEIPQDTLREYGLTLNQVSQIIGSASVELPAGGIETSSGEILIRTDERREIGSEYAEIIVLSRPDGSQVRLGEIATITDGFQDSDIAAFFNGERAAEVQVFRVGDETPIDVSDAVYEYIDEHGNELPGSLSLAVVNDGSEIYADRINLLLKNAFLGLALVLIVLGVFLELKLAFWVTLGIPISFLGAMLFMPGLDVSLNMISLFAFILTLGIVVDDAIVVGEAIYNQRQRGLTGLRAALAGVKEVAGPVTFSVLTTVMAFMPLLFVPGASGKIMYSIPVVVIAVLLLSLVESLLVLPAHLAHSKGGFSGGLLGLVSKAQERFSQLFERFVQVVYVPSARGLMRIRYLTLAFFFSGLLVTISFVAGGYVPFTFLPKVEGEYIVVNLEMPFGTPVEDTEEIIRHIEEVAFEILEDNGGADEIGEGVYVTLGTGGSAGSSPGGGESSSGSHVAGVVVYLVPMDQRDIRTGEFTAQWRERIGEVAGIESLTFDFNTGPSGGSPVDVELSHPDTDVLEAAGQDLAARLAQYAGVMDIKDGVSEGKVQFDVRLLPSGRAYGITEQDLAIQLRSAYFGAEAQRQQRGRDEVRTYVRWPEEERSSEYYLENMMLRTPDGRDVPFYEVATLERGRSYTSITREASQRVINVTADVDNAVTTGNEVFAGLVANDLPELMERYPGLSWSKAGEQEEQAQTMTALATGMGFALLAMYALMAVAFRSYIQPVIIMIAIPFGFIGAIFGHMLLGYSLSLMSMFGLVALSGVVVNDSLVLIDSINSYRKEGMPPFEAVVAGGARRMRPIILTSFTTFFGLAPMIAETSVQARFLIPMAISLGFGVLLVTFITMMLIPAVYLVLEDIQNVLTFLARLIVGEHPRWDEHAYGIHTPDGVWENPFLYDKPVPTADSVFDSDNTDPSNRGVANEGFDATHESEDAGGYGRPWTQQDTGGHDTGVGSPASSDGDERTPTPDAGNDPGKSDSSESDPATPG